MFIIFLFLLSISPVHAGLIAQAKPDAGGSSGVHAKSSGKHPSRSPEAFYFDGKTVKRLSTIFLPNLGTADIRLFVYSVVELKGAAIDSSEIGICIPTAGEKAKLKLPVELHAKRGRWYRISFMTTLRVGVTRHVLETASFYGRKYRQEFSVAVEGAARLKRPSTNK